MKIEKLKKGNKKIIIRVIIFIAIFSALIINPSKAKYRTTQSIPLVRGTIKYNPADLNLVAMYQENETTGEYISIDEVPSSGYNINTEKSYCEVKGTKDENITIEYKNSQIYVNKLTKKGTKCYLYFDISCGKACKTILANMNTINEREDFSIILTDTTIGTIYKAEDDDGVSYYFAGAPIDNWVKFAGFYWRIIRINGDGSIRMIYAGTDPSVTTGAGTQIGTSVFNSIKTDNKYVGYMYTENQVHGLGTNSAIKILIDSWYINNLSNYSEYIDADTGFCSDRTAYTDTEGEISGGGTGTTDTLYGAWIRLYKNRTPTFKCPEISDLYTINNSNKGNKALTYPIGLITADEISYAGGVLNINNTSYYLRTNQVYWTISPYSYHGSYGAGVWGVNSAGPLSSTYVNTAIGVRPVINLKAGTTFTSGSKGTSSAPYIIDGAE